MRASLTVKMKDGARFDANHLCISIDNSKTDEFFSVLSFISDGICWAFPAAEVESVHFRPTGAIHCNECGGLEIRNMKGDGIHANEPWLNKLGETHHSG